MLGAMYKNLSVGAVIPACNEEDNIGAVVTALLDLRTDAGHRVIDDVVVCDNGSTDATAMRARKRRVPAWSSRRRPATAWRA